MIQITPGTNKAMTSEARLFFAAGDRSNQDELRALICERVRRAAGEALAELRARQQCERKRHGEEEKIAGDED
jgi:hypothetical protein